MVSHLVVGVIKAMDNISQMLYTYNKIKANFCFARWETTWRWLEQTDADTSVCRKWVKWSNPGGYAMTTKLNKCWMTTPARNKRKKWILITV